jgi:outer membrane protein assembly factor BamB
MDLTKTKWDETSLGLNVYVEGEGVGGGSIWAARADGKPIWKIKDTCGSVDVDVLPNGHVLLAEWQTQSITEYDRESKMVWTKKLSNYPTTCRRLPNGNTFIATFSELMEVDPKGTAVYTYKNPLGALILRAHRYPNGHLLFASAGGNIVELDAKGNQVRAIKMPTNSSAWMSIQPLPGDRFLIGLRGENKIIEIDGAGKLLWECAATDPMSSYRLPNGNTLIACAGAKTVIEVDRNGKGVSELKLERGVYCVRRY